MVSNLLEEFFGRVDEIIEQKILPFLDVLNKTKYESSI